MSLCEEWLISPLIYNLKAIKCWVLSAQLGLHLFRVLHTFFFLLK